MSYLKLFLITNFVLLLSSLSFAFVVKPISFSSGVHGESFKWEGAAVTDGNVKCFLMRTGSGSDIDCNLSDSVSSYPAKEYERVYIKEIDGWFSRQFKEDSYCYIFEPLWSYNRTVNNSLKCLPKKK